MRAIFTIASAALALLLSGAAFAVDDGGHAGLCKPLSETDSTFLKFRSDGIYNYTGTAATVTCGTLRLSTSSPTTLYVDYTDNTASGEISCGARIWHWNNKKMLWSQTKTSGVATKGYSAFKFTLPSTIAGYVELQCTLPGFTVGSASIIRGFNLQ